MDPTAFRRDDLRTSNEEGARVTRRGVRGVQEGPPWFDVFGGRKRIDTGEKVLAGAREPWFGDNATLLERL